MASGRRASGLDGIVQTMLSVAGLRAKQQSDYGRHNSPMWEVNYSVWNVTIRHIGLLCWYHDGRFTIHCLVRKFRQSYMLPVMYVIMSSKEAAILVCQFLLVPTCYEKKQAK